MTVVIGLTGSIATGKSTISQRFEDYDIPVIDADKISRKVVEPGEKAYDKIVDAFGQEILHGDNMIDRKALGAIVFNDEEKRNTLNGIVHPAVREKMLEERDEYVAQGKKAVVLDIPLLFESELTHFVEKILVVYVDEDVQLDRLMERDESTEEEAKSRINSQMPVSQKAEKADAVITNNGTKQESYNQLEEILRKWEVI